MKVGTKINVNFLQTNLTINARDTNNVCAILYIEQCLLQNCGNLFQSLYVFY